MNCLTCPARMPCRHQASQATPPKLSQNPGRRTESGSSPSTMIAAMAIDCATPDCRRSPPASATNTIINTVRSVGSDAPLASR